MKKLVVPLLVITLGIAWILNVRDILPGVNWIWTIGLAISGIICLIIDKINKFNFVLGLFLIIASVFSILRQTDRIPEDIEVPSLFITLGILMLVAQLVKLPSPSWVIDKPKDDNDTAPKL